MPILFMGARIFLNFIGGGGGHHYIENLPLFSGTLHESVATTLLRDNACPATLLAT